MPNFALLLQHRFCFEGMQKPNKNSKSSNTFKFKPRALKFLANFSRYSFGEGRLHLNCAIGLVLAFTESTANNDDAFTTYSFNLYDNLLF